MNRLGMDNSLFVLRCFGSRDDHVSTEAVMATFEDCIVGSMAHRHTVHTCTFEVLPDAFEGFGISDEEIRPAVQILVPHP